MQPRKPVIESDLHSYADGELDDTSRLKVEAYLVEHPEELERVHEYQDINSGLHELYDYVLNEPVPKRLSIPESIENPPVDYSKSLKAVAAVSFAIISGIVGWIAHDQWNAMTDMQRLTHLVEPAKFAHYVYSTDQYHPVEFTAEKKDELASWLSDRMHTDIKAPALSNLGFTLIGGRLLPSTNRMAAQFMYQNSDDKKITVYVRRDDWGSRATEFQYMDENGVKVFFWSDGEMGYAVTGDIHKKLLIQAAENIQGAFVSAKTL